MEKIKDRLVIPKKKKRIKKGKLRELAWKEFSRFIRLRDSDENGICKCCTCDFKGHWKNGGYTEKGKLVRFQAGHFPQGRSNSILFLEKGVHSQCWQCNCPNNGRLDVYAKFMIDKYGINVIQEMNDEKNKSLTYFENDYIEIAEKYKRLADIYERNKK